MSGTSMDGVDASIIQSDGKTKYKVILNKYFKYSKEIYQKLINLRNKIKKITRFKKIQKKIKFSRKGNNFISCRMQKKILKKKKKY